MHESEVADRTGLTLGENGRGGRGGWFSGGGRDGNAGRSRTPERAYITGIVIALGAVAMFFAALVSAAVVRRGSPSGDWQPLRGASTVWPILALNTMVLLASSFTLSHSRLRARSGDDAGFRRWWIVTSALGAIFLAGQLFAWRQIVGAGLYLATNPSSSFFYLLTAAHGAHVAAGIVALLVIACRPARRMARRTAIEVTSVYWHAMGAIWIFLFLFLFFGGRS
ncbi:MAG: cytochrome c oxidase subunit 3 [Acidobacteriota bacterium]|nr:cytochrome c oxidase subunit 3 [Acidobacteriota bacterium]